MRATVTGAEDSDLVLTLQSSVACGNVGNAAAAFALQRLGRDVIRIDTVRFSNHPKHGGYSGGPTPAAEMNLLVDGLAERGLLSQVGAVLSGYLGTAENAAAVARAVEAVKAVRPDAVYCLDPVMGDRPGGRFVAETIPPVIQNRLLPLADIATPNAFELELLSGIAVQDVATAADAAKSLAESGKLIVATGIHTGENLVSIVAAGARAWQVRTPIVDAPAYGAGDLFCAVFLARRLEGLLPTAALAQAASSVHAVFAETRRRGSPELALIPAQAALANPPHIFSVEEI